MGKLRMAFEMGPLARLARSDSFYHCIVRLTLHRVFHHIMSPISYLSHRIDVF